MVFEKGNKIMKFFYQSGAMGYGEGYAWHSMFGSFPDFPIVTKTFTLKKKKGTPWKILWLPGIGESTWNKVALHNPGLENVVKDYDSCFKDIIVSIHGTDGEIQVMCDTLDPCDIKGIELNYSCPNVANKMNKRIPETDHPLYLKLNYTQNPTHYDLDRIERINLNSIPTRYGGISGKYAQQYNWKYIEKWREKIETPISGCSWVCEDDIRYLHNVLKCEYIGIGSQMLTIPSLIQDLPEIFKGEINGELQK